MTIYEDAFLSLTDYQNSPAEVLFFPKVEDGEDRVRQPEVWRRGDYDLLTKNQLDRCVENFVVARETARQILIDELESLRTRQE